MSPVERQIGYALKILENKYCIVDINRNLPPVSIGWTIIFFQVHATQPRPQNYFPLFLYFAVAGK